MFSPVSLFWSYVICPLFFFFFFNDTATTEIYTLSLHDALPIYGGRTGVGDERDVLAAAEQVEDAPQRGRRGMRVDAQQVGAGADVREQSLRVAAVFRRAPRPPPPGLGPARREVRPATARGRPPRDRAGHL